MWMSVVFSQDYSAYQIYTKKGKKTNFSAVLKQSENKKVVFFGEHHNDPIAHWLQLELLFHLHKINGNNLICGSEMFEQDNQKALNSFLNGKIEEKSLKDSVRLWPNFKTDYLPLLDFAKSNQIPWIATNIPRKYASLVYKKGIKSLDTINSIEKTWIVPLPIEVDTTLSQYSALLNSAMHMGNNFVYAQAIKDATMAWFIYQNLKNEQVFYHLNGTYHSDYFQGIMWYLNYYSKIPITEMLSIATVSQKNCSTLEKEHIGKADFILCVPENMTKTH